MYLETFGPEVCDVGVEAGFVPDPEQELFLDLLFAIGPDGKSVSFENGLIGPRQNLKTGTIKLAELGWLFVTEEPLIIHSAHELDMTESAFNDLRELIENAPDLARHLDRTIGNVDTPGIKTGNGKASIFIRTAKGQRLQIKYKARTRTGGRGLTGNKLVLDEAFALTPAMVGSVYPTLSAVPDPQVLLASSAGLLESSFLRSVRDRGRAGGDPRLLWMEYADDVAKYGRCRLPNCDHAKPPNSPPGCALDDETRWARFMTALGRRITPQTIRDMRRSMPVAEFAREFMVWWEDPPEGDDAGVLDLQAWGRLRDPEVVAPSRVVATVAVAADRSRASVALAGAGPAGKTLVLTRTGAGTAWVVPALMRIRAKGVEVAEVSLREATQAAVLKPALKAARMEYHPLTATEEGQACATFVNAVNVDGSIVHVGADAGEDAEALTRAMRNSTTRFVSQVEQWDLRDPAVDICPVVAASAAVYRWQVAPPPPPPPSPVGVPVESVRDQYDGMGFPAVDDLQF
ncbi:hypothetical protein K8Z61_18485 [Nocardioides sp. TRM66260-LWL]|uniref:hypothetical protein n=1 Tax=Nocardioides sp. TRM66260-LWL TaxID=2874478 RepID=UPI001CC788E0|nr:hypothetical protein [Nocardioides sp. TRM66260-LWL]MBZ5736483.1 hypothetical protein [Nocardioides sp. TRM66260-LWL]